jgi:Hypothetical protein (DUF2513)
MQVLDLRQRTTMKRDDDLIRGILIRIEGDPQMDGTREFYFNSAEDMGFPGRSSEELAYNFSLLVEAGFVDGAATAFLPIIVRRLTWNGHQFLENIKSDTIWAKTKNQVKDLPGISLKVIAEIAEALIRKHVGLS